MAWLKSLNLHDSTIASECFDNANAPVTAIQKAADKS